MDEQLKSNLTSGKHWMRLVYMVLFAIFLYVASFVISFLVVVQFVFALVTGSDNSKLRQFGFSLSAYIHQALQFLTYNSEVKPFPFSDWPEPPAAVQSEEHDEGVDPDPEASSARPPNRSSSGDATTSHSAPSESRKTTPSFSRSATRAPEALETTVVDDTGVAAPASESGGVVEPEEQGRVDQPLVDENPGSSGTSR